MLNRINNRWIVTINRFELGKWAIIWVRVPHNRTRKCDCIHQHHRNTYFTLFRYTIPIPDISDISINIHIYTSIFVKCMEYANAKFWKERLVCHSRVLRRRLVKLFPIAISTEPIINFPLIKRGRVGERGSLLRFILIVVMSKFKPTAFYN